MHRRHRHDSNQFHMEQDLVRLGFSVADTSQCSTVSFPDLVIGRQGVDAKVEVKHHSQVTAAQAQYHALWRGSPTIVAYDVTDVLNAFNALVARMRRY